MISVIVPVYNTERCLAQCVDSILNSTYGDFELILVNDGSTDNSLKLCREYCRRDSRVRLIDQKNQGVSAARNRGIESSRGEWVVFVDSDDCISPDFFSMVAEEETAELLLFDFAKNRRELEEAAGRAERTQGIPIPLDSAEDRADLIERLLGFRQLTEGGHTDLRSSCGKAYRRSVLGRPSVRFSPGVLVSEDVLFNAAVFLTVRRCKYISVPVYLYTVRMSSATHSYVPGLLQSCSAFQVKLKDTLESHQMFSLLEEPYYAKTLENMAYLLIRGIFNPYGNSTVREARALCRQMREDTIYAAALRYNYKTGNLPRRLLLGFFQLRCYWIVKVICRVCFFWIEQIDKRRERQPVR